MKISRISTALVDANWRNFTFVQIYTDAGLVGLGEATIRSREHAVVGAIEDMSRVLIGQDPFQIQAHWQTLYQAFHKRGGVILMAAISAIEIALWDILGQALSVPLYQLLGGKMRDRVRVYNNGWFEGLQGLEALTQAAQQAVQAGFTALKWNPFHGAHGWLSPAQRRRVLEEVDAIRQAVGEDVDLMLEAHGLFTPAAAVRIANDLAAYQPFWLEEPVPPEDEKAMAFVRQRSPIPIAAGERVYGKYEFARLIEARAVDIVQPDITYAGGIFETRLIAAQAEARYLGFAPHNSGSPVSTAVALHLAACTPNFVILELPTNDVPWRAELVEPVIEAPSQGHLPLLESPGLGVTLNEKTAQQHPYQNPDRAYFSAVVTPEMEQLKERLKNLPPTDEGNHGLGN
ncbi:MAG: mandelate racemase/muconate lactonizing enzyme family protein [Anaerolineales bacterium]|nr:mandelate racemase/muconate lactonizing enzyme family protein [Anaerolineales bacterium]